MRLHEFKTESWLPLPPAQLFPFFSEARNLDAITPPWLHFRISSPNTIEMRVGALIDYKLSVRGVPLRWRTRINVWEPPLRFVDEQIRGPYRLWIHEHTFVACDGGTEVRDRVRYAVPFDCLLHSFIRRDIETIFQFRTESLRKRFAEVPRIGAA